MRSTRSNLFWLLFTSAGVVGVAACGSKSEDAGWKCRDVRVPMGETTECTTAAFTTDGPGAPSGSGTTTDGTASGAGATTDGTLFTYYCPPGSTDPACPPPAIVGGGTTDGTGGTGGTGTSGGTGTTGGGTTDGTGNDSGATTPPAGGADGGTASGGTTDGTGADGGTTTGGGPSTSGGGSGSGGTTDGTTPTECGEAPDLSYCPGGSPTGTGTGTGDSSGTGTGAGADAGAGGTTDGTTPHGGSNGDCDYDGTGTGDSRQYVPPALNIARSGGFVCTRAGEGRLCQRLPKCARGTHASTCGACIADAAKQSECIPPVRGGCWLTGAGSFGDGSSVRFGGSAKPLADRAIEGEWEHTDARSGQKTHGDLKYMLCEQIPGGGRIAYMGGPARQLTGGTWVDDGTWFDVVAEDHGGKGDTYRITVRKQVDAHQQVSGSVVYESKGTLTSGALQVHTPRRGAYLSHWTPVWLERAQP